MNVELGSRRLPPCLGRSRVACSCSVRTLALVLAVVLAALASAALGCRDKASSGEIAKAAPLPAVTDATTELLFTWIDDKGEFHQEQRVADVPSVSREVVRIIDPGHEDPPGKIFIADLRNALPDGTYVVRAAPRDDFENVALERRKKSGTVLAARPPPTAEPDVPGAPSGSATTPSGRAPVVIYGAEWCGPCHQAEAYLRQKGIPHVKKDIEKDPSAAREMQSKLARAGRGGGSIPVLDVRGKILIGFDPRAVDRALGEAL